MDGPFDLSGPEDNLATGAFDVSSIMNPPQNSAQKAKSNADDLSSAYKAVAALKAVEPKSYEQIQKERRENHISKQDLAEGSKLQSNALWTTS